MDYSHDYHRKFIALLFVPFFLDIFITSLSNVILATDRICRIVMTFFEADTSISSAPFMLQSICA